MPVKVNFQRKIFTYLSLDFYKKFKTGELNLYFNFKNSYLPKKKEINLHPKKGKLTQIKSNIVIIIMQ